MRKKVIAGNWKMNMLPNEAMRFIEELAPKKEKKHDKPKQKKPRQQHKPKQNNQKPRNIKGNNPKGKKDERRN